ncbi:MAG TPA: V-type ATP synthase subunit E [Candidatus Sabulitectum sp.]|nr:V-type ATP synthase subunit E [Candidatus Sabulitectum sp.]
MSLEAILAKIEQDAREKADGILAEAEGEKNEALHKVRSSIKDRHHTDLDRIRQRVELRSRRMKHHLHREMEKALLSHRRHLVDRAIEQAVRDIAGDKDYLNLIEALLSGCDLTGEVEVVTAEADSGRITPEFLRKASSEKTTFVLSADHHGDCGGIIMRSGDISLNATLSMLAELNHDSMVMELSRLLPLEGQGD